MATKSYRHPSIDSVALEEVLQALADPIRLTIIRELLKAGEMACGDVPLKVSKATRSHHFSILRNAGLILTRADGARCMTSVRCEDIQARFPGLLDLVTALPGR